MIKTRYAPSPTGFLHIGGLRTALYAYALAKKNKGNFILRIEDTDKKREVVGGVKNVIDMLNIFNITFDEGPEVGGPNGPYIQSQRLKIYQQKAKELVEKGVAYYCFCSSERLEKLKKEQTEQKKQPRYDRKCRNLTKEEIENKLKNKERYVIRLKVPENKILKINDMVMGEVSWNSNDINDQVLLKSDGYPTYHLGVVVDDILMEITHITRGIEWMPSVPKHLLIFEAFDYNVPVMAHLPIILDPDGGKLSKRKGAVSVEQFLEQGYLTEAILNFLMLLGWSAPIKREFGEKEREFFSLEEFVELFDLKDLNKASPVFDREKLIWFNQKYIQNLPSDEFENRFLLWLRKYYKDKHLKELIISKGPDYLQKILLLIKDRIKTLEEIPSHIKLFYKIENKVELKEIKRFKNADFNKLLLCLEDFSIELGKVNKDLSGWNHDKWEMIVRNIGDNFKQKHGHVFMALRIAILNSEFSPPLFESMQILGRDEVLQRIKNYLKN